MKLLALLLLASPLSAQHIFVDSNTKQYQADSLFADTVAVMTSRIATQLGLTDWRIFLYFEPLGTEKVDILATTTATAPYRVAHITIDLPDLKKLIIWAREETIRHELLHVVLWEYVSYIRLFVKEEAWEVLSDLTERITTHLSRMPVWSEKKKSNSMRQ